MEIFTDYNILFGNFIIGYRIYGGYNIAKEYAALEYAYDIRIKSGYDPVAALFEQTPLLFEL